MAQIRTSENIAKLAKTSATTLSFPASVVNVGGNAAETDGTFTWVVETAAQGTEAKGFIQTGGAAGANWSVTMPMRPVVVASGDANKTVAVTYNINGIRGIVAFAQAVRIA